MKNIIYQKQETISTKSYQVNITQFEGPQEIQLSDVTVVAKRLMTFTCTAGSSRCFIREGNNSDISGQRRKQIAELTAEAIALTPLPHTSIHE